MTSATPSAPARSSATWAAWAILIGMGGTETTYNIWHATHGGHMPIGLALLYGLAPVAAAILLSHIVAEYDGGRFLQGAAFVIMLAAMSLSAYATAVTVTPAAGPCFAWVFGLTLDAAALVALRVILSGRSRKAEAAAAIEAARGAVQEARAEAAEATGERSRLAAEMERMRAEHGAQMDALKAELEAARAKVPARKSRRGSGRKPARTSARNLVPASAPEPDLVPAGTSAPEEDLGLDAEALILKYLEEGHSASQAGIMAGKSDSYGRQVARLAKAARPEPAGTERTNGDMS